jgi:general secretion pathway protein J
VIPGSGVAAGEGCLPARAHGFTLVEVLVALTILSLILVTTVTALRTLGNSQTAIENVTNRVDEVRAVSNFLRDILESTVVGANDGLTTGGGTRDASYFRSAQDYLEFKSTVLFGESYGGSFLVRVAKEDTSLVFRWQESPVEGVPRDWSEMPSRVMLEQLEEFRVFTRNDFAQAWSEQRSDDDFSVPVLVRLQVKAAGRYWPDLIMRVQREQ